MANSHCARTGETLGVPENLPALNRLHEPSQNVTAREAERNPELRFKSKFAKQLFQPHVPKWSVLTRTMLPCCFPKPAAPRRSSDQRGKAVLPLLCSRFAHRCVQGAEVLICFVAKILVPFVGIKQILFGEILYSFKDKSNLGCQLLFVLQEMPVFHPKPSMFCSSIAHPRQWL